MSQTSCVYLSVCRWVCRSQTHPLADMLRDCEQSVTEVTGSLYNKYHAVISNYPMVPFPLPAETANCVAQAKSVGGENEPEVCENESLNIEEEDVEKLDNEFEINYNMATDQVKAARYKTDKEIGKLLSDGLTETGESVKLAGDWEDKDEMDSLFDSDEEDAINVSRDSSEDRNDNSENLDDCTPTTANGTADVLEVVDELEKSAATYHEQLSIVIERIHEVTNALKTLLILAYVKLKGANDIVNSVIQEILFTDVGEQLEFLYR